MKQTELFEMPEQDPRYKNKNPMVRAHGFGPKGERCKTCRSIFCRHEGKRYYKCKFRGDTRGEATDHRCNWDSCVYYEKVQCENCWDKKRIRSHTVWPNGSGPGVKGEPVYIPCPECQKQTN